MMWSVPEAVKNLAEEFSCKTQRKSPSRQYSKCVRGMQADCDWNGPQSHQMCKTQKVEWRMLGAGTADKCSMGAGL